MEGAAQGLVLISNNNNALPLSPGKSIAVIGPLAAANYALMGDYYADAVCPGGTPPQKGGYTCVPTIAQSIQALNNKYAHCLLRGSACGSCCSV